MTSHAMIDNKRVKTTPVKSVTFSALHGSDAVGVKKTSPAKRGFRFPQNNYRKGGYEVIQF